MILDGINILLKTLLKKSHKKVREKTIWYGTQSFKSCHFKIEKENVLHVLKIIRS